ncbi:copper resistance protein [Bacteroidia bacterium]|nr:copper resistance protein [Bacteroidia bacterium]GHT46175.1 copper resistance protein [Bacteroidia bacterium]
MKKVFFAMVAVAVLSVASFVSCGGGQQKKSEEVVISSMADNSRTSLDWGGKYTGVIPCADCEGIQVTIVLNPSTYELSYLYLGTNDNTPTQIVGEFSWDETGSIVNLKNDASIPPYYQVGENRLIQLDMEGKPITGELADKYELTKNSADL